ncbi:MAG: hypothetical protein U5J95_02505 [Balneolaceae bacterium]|nr:hypothetical protein [Balneolaceae bacterium]
MSSESRILQKVQTDKDFPRVSLTEPTQSGYIQLAAEVDSRPPFFPSSKSKRELLKTCKNLCEKLKQRTDVISALTFKAVLIPPGRGEFLRKRPEVHIARFDVAILIETASPERAKALKEEPIFTELEAAVRETARHVHLITATNIKRMGPVDHQADGIFLFNYFYADDTEQNLAVWEYTAGWFKQQTGLDNSTLLLPENEEASEYSVINHCRWDSLWDILPSILFKPTFGSYVLANFEANRTAAIPILYKLA